MIALPPSVALDADHFVYSVYDEADWLLYVGCSRDVSARMRAHVKGNAWWVRHVRYVRAVGPLPCLDAFELESALIYRLAPLGNVMHNREWVSFCDDLRAEAWERARQSELASMWPAMQAAINRLSLPSAESA